MQLCGNLSRLAAIVTVQEWRAFKREPECRLKRAVKNRIRSSVAEVGEKDCNRFVRFAHLSVRKIPAQS